MQAPSKRGNATPHPPKRRLVPDSPTPHLTAARGSGTRRSAAGVYARPPRTHAILPAMSRKRNTPAAIDAVEAFTIARDWAKANTYPFEPNFAINFYDGAWHIDTDCSALGCNLEVTVDAKTGAVMKHDWNPE